MRSILILLLVLITACASRPKKEELKKAWIGQELVTLEKHKYFSTLPLEKKEISSKETLINISERRYRATGGQTCFGSGFGFGYYSRFGVGASACSPQEYTQDNCTHQFTIENKKVINYNYLGDYCELACKYLPRGKCPKK